jgi:hypothetical protein
MGSRRNIGFALAGAFAFGLFAAWAKDQGAHDVHGLAQARAQLGNLSMPWLLVAFAAGTQAHRLGSGAMLGLAATATALVGFYVATALVVDPSAQGFASDLRLELSANRGYFEGGLLSGPLFGALGAWWQQRRSYRASVFAGALLMAEPLVLLALGVVFPGGVSTAGGLPLLVRMIPGWGLASGSGQTAVAVYGVEFALGMALVALPKAVRLARQPPPA